MFTPNSDSLYMMPVTLVALTKIKKMYSQPVGIMMSRCLQ